MDEIRAVSDRVTVIRRGNQLKLSKFAGATNADLAEMMVGRSVSFKTEKQASQPKEVVLSIKDLVVNENRGVPAVKNLPWMFVLERLLVLQGLMEMVSLN